MRKIYILGVLAFLLLAVGPASATVTDFYINQANKDATLDSGTGPIIHADEISIHVFINDQDQTIKFVDESGSDLTHHGMTWVAYNTENLLNANQITGTTIGGSTLIGNSPFAHNSDPWSTKNNFGAQGDFGNLLNVYSLSQPSQANRCSQIIVKLPINWDGKLKGNDFGNKVGVHFVCDEFSCFVSGYYEKQIPEFPSVVLPVAAILGILVIFGRRKKE